MEEAEFWASTPVHFDARMERDRLARMRQEVGPAMTVSAITRGKTPFKRLVFSARPSDFMGPVPRTQDELRTKINSAFGQIIAFRKAEKGRLGRGG